MNILKKNFLVGQSVLIILMLAFSVITQLMFDFTPCLLCQMQRVLLVLAFVVALPRFFKLEQQYVLLVSYISQAGMVLLGVAVAVRHLRLLSMAGNSEVCIPDNISLWLGNLWDQWLSGWFGGVAECQNPWNIWGIEVSYWVLLGYAAVLYFMCLEYKSKIKVNL